MKTLYEPAKAAEVQNGRYYDFDAEIIEYPGVQSCLTITYCFEGKGVWGAHFGMFPDSSGKEVTNSFVSSALDNLKLINNMPVTGAMAVLLIGDVQAWLKNEAYAEMRGDAQARLGEEHYTELVIFNHKRYADSVTITVNSEGYFRLAAGERATLYYYQDFLPSRAASAPVAVQVHRLRGG